MYGSLCLPLLQYSMLTPTRSLQLLSLYMALRDESGEPLSRQALRDALLNLIMWVAFRCSRIMTLR